MLYNIITAKSCITPTQCMANEITAVSSCKKIERHHYINPNLWEDRLLVSAVEICQKYVSGNTSAEQALGPWRKSKREKSIYLCCSPLGWTKSPPTELLIWSYLSAVSRPPPVMHLQSIPLHRWVKHQLIRGLWLLFFVFLFIPLFYRRSIDEEDSQWSFQRSNLRKSLTTGNLEMLFQ